MKYNLNPLTITVDNHFRSVQADRNLQRALKIADVDHQMIRRGDMERNEAMKLLKKEEIEDPTPILQYFRSRLSQ